MILKSYWYHIFSFRITKMIVWKICFLMATLFELFGNPIYPIILRRKWVHMTISNSFGKDKNTPKWYKNHIDIIFWSFRMNKMIVWKICSFLATLFLYYFFHQFWRQKILKWDHIPTSIGSLSTKNTSKWCKNCMYIIFRSFQANKNTDWKICSFMVPLFVVLLFR